MYNPQNYLDYLLLIQIFKFELKSICNYTIKRPLVLFLDYIAAEVSNSQDTIESTQINAGNEIIIAHQEASKNNCENLK